MNHEINFKLNDEQVKVFVEPQKALVDLLRDEMELTGTKESCGDGQCGSCTVLIDGVPFNSCLTLGVAADGKSVETIEGLAQGEKLHPIQQAFTQNGAVQCGYCTPGMIMTAKGLLTRNPDPSKDEIRHQMAGNLCRCTGYEKIIDAVHTSAEMLKEVK